MASREQWIATNIHSVSISLGSLFPRALKPGKSTDLLDFATKEDIEKSVDIKEVLDAEHIRITKYIDGVVTETVTDSSDLADDGVDQTELDSKLDADLGNQPDGFLQLNEDGEAVGVFIPRLDTKANIDILAGSAGEIATLSDQVGVVRVLTGSTPTGGYTNRPNNITVADVAVDTFIMCHGDTAVFSSVSSLNIGEAFATHLRPPPYMGARLTAQCVVGAGHFIFIALNNSDSSGTVIGNIFYDVDGTLFSGGTGGFVLDNSVGGATALGTITLVSIKDETNTKFVWQAVSKTSNISLTN